MSAPSHCTRGMTYCFAWVICAQAISAYCGHMDPSANMDAMEVGVATVVKREWLRILKEKGKDIEDESSEDGHEDSDGNLVSKCSTDSFKEAKAHVMAALKGLTQSVMREQNAAKPFSKRKTRKETKARLKDAFPPKVTRKESTSLPMKAYPSEPKTKAASSKPPTKSTWGLQTNAVGTKELEKLTLVGLTIWHYMILYDIMLCHQD